MADFEVGNFRYSYVNVSSRTVSVDGFSTAITADTAPNFLYIPDTVSYNNTTFNVIEVGNYAFDATLDDRCLKIINISFNKNLEIIGLSSFYGCANAISFSYHSSSSTRAKLRFIGRSAFANCGLRTVELEAPFLPGNRMVDLSDSAFEGCASLTSFSVKNSFPGEERLWPVILGPSCFKGCSSLQSFSVALGPDEVSPEISTIKSEAFKDCSSLTSLSFNTVSQKIVIQDSVFAGCISLLPASVTELLKKTSSIGAFAFNGCTGLKIVNLADSDIVGANPFVNCAGIEAFTVSESNASLTIGDYFVIKNESIICGCKRSFVTGRPASVTSIGASAFEGITFTTDRNLVSTSIISIGDRAFYGSTNLKSVTISGVSSIGSYSFYKSTLQEINITNSSNSLTIGDHAFDSCVNIAAFDFEGASVSSIGESAFNNCTSLVEINLVGLSFLGNSAFYNCINLVNVSLPFVGANTTTPGLFSTFFNSRITSVFVSSSNDYALGSKAFAEYTSIRFIELSRNVIQVGEKCFEGCTDLETLTCRVAVAGVYGAPNLKNLRISFGDGTSFSSFNWSFADYLPLKTVTFLEESNVNAIVGNFSGCTGLTSIINLSGQKITSIGASCFKDCTSLQFSDEMLSDLTTIEAYAFSGCSNLISNSSGTLTIFARSVAAGAFQNCTNIKEIIINNFNTGLGAGCFSGCINLASMQAPFVGSSSTTQVEVSGETYQNQNHLAWSFCLSAATEPLYSMSFLYSVPKNLKSYTIAKAGTKVLERIGNGAFFYCGSLKTVIIQPNALLQLTSDSMIFSDSGVSNFTCDASIAVSSGLSTLGLNLTLTNTSGREVTMKTNAFKIELNIGTVKLDPDIIITGAFSDQYITKMIAPVNIKDLGGATKVSTLYLCGDPANPSKSQLTTKLNTETKIGTLYLENVSLISENVFSSSNLTNLYIEVERSSDISVEGVIFDENRGTFVYVLASSANSWNSNFANGNPVIWDYKRNNVASDGYIYLYYPENSSVKLLYKILGNTAEVARNTSVAPNTRVLPEIVYKGKVYSVTKIGDQAFLNCTLEFFGILQGITEIGDHAFEGAQFIYSFSDLPAGLLKIGASAFENASITKGISFNIPSTVTSIGKDAFAGTSLITDWNNTGVAIKNNWIIGIADSTKTEIDLGGGISGTFNIADSVFKNMTTLISFSLANAYLGIIGNSAFEGCTNLTTISTNSNKETVPIIRERAFYGCSKLIKSDEDFITDSINGYLCCLGAVLPALSSSLIDFALPKDALVICDSPFAAPNQSVRVGTLSFKTPTFVSIGEAFKKNVSELKNVIFDEPSTHLEVVFGCLIDQTNKKVLAGLSDTKIAIPVAAQLKIIDSYCFYNIKGSDIIIPSSVVKIGDHAFDSFYPVSKTFRIPDSVQFLGEGCFSNSQKIEEVILSKNIVEIPKECFLNNMLLKKVVTSADLLVIKERAFSGANGIEFFSIGGVETPRPGYLLPKPLTYLNTLLRVSGLFIDGTAFSSVSLMQELSLPPKSFYKF